MREAPLPWLILLSFPPPCVRLLVTGQTTIAQPLSFLLRRRSRCHRLAPFFLLLKSSYSPLLAVLSSLDLVRRGSLLDSSLLLQALAPSWGPPRARGKYASSWTPFPFPFLPPFFAPAENQAGGERKILTTSSPSLFLRSSCKK